MVKVAEVATGQDKEALGWRLRVKRKFGAVKFRLRSEENARSLSAPGSAGQDATISTTEIKVTVS